MFEFKIERIGEKGDGLGAGRSFARTLPDEIVNDVGNVLIASQDRVTPFCPVFDRCGGCKLQHWATLPYQAWKTALLTQALAARGLHPEIQPLIDAHGDGRRRVALHVREIDGRWRAGFMAEGSHNLVPIDVCPILTPKLQAVPELAAKFGIFFGACDVTVAAVENGLDVAIKATRKLADQAVAQFDGLMRAQNIMRIAVNGETRAQLTPPLVKMTKAMVPIPVGGFLQATEKGENTLTELILSHAKKFKRVADLFCGSGPFTFALAQQHTVHAVDSEKPAIAALQMAVRNTRGLKPITAEVRDLFRNPLTTMELKEYDLVVLDPPRSGAEAQCVNLAKSKVKRVVYVSCDVQSLGRDAAVLCQGGYRFETALPVDQFKFSPHLETVALFSRA
ncbi:MAG TPA: methyltransferase [Aestuariivirga sp.]